MMRDPTAISITNSRTDGEWVERLASHLRDEGLRVLSNHLDSNELFHEIGDSRALARTLCQLGSLLSEQDQPGPAADALIVAADLFDSLGSASDARSVRRRLGSIRLQGLSEHDNADKKGATIAAVLAMAHEDGDSRLTAGALRVYAAVLDSDKLTCHDSVESEISAVDTDEPEIAAELARVRLIQKRHDEALQLVDSVGRNESIAAPTRIRALFVGSESRMAKGLSGAWRCWSKGCGWPAPEATRDCWPKVTR